MIVTSLQGWQLWPKDLTVFSICSSSEKRTKRIITQWECCIEESGWESTWTNISPWKTINLPSPNQWETTFGSFYWRKLGLKSIPVIKELTEGRYKRFFMISLELQLNIFRWGKHLSIRKQNGTILLWLLKESIQWLPHQDLAPIKIKVKLVLCKAMRIPFSMPLSSRTVEEKHKELFNSEILGAEEKAKESGVTMIQTGILWPHIKKDELDT